MVAAVAVMAVGFGTVVIPWIFSLRAAGLAAVAAACIFLADRPPGAGRRAIAPNNNKNNNTREMTVDHQQLADLRRRRAARIAETLALVRVLDPGTAAAPAHLAAIKPK